MEYDPEKVCVTINGIEVNPYIPKLEKWWKITKETDTTITYDLALKDGRIATVELFSDSKTSDLIQSQIDSFDSPFTASDQ